jgi:hypothetical protein
MQGVYTGAIGEFNKLLLRVGCHAGSFGVAAAAGGLLQDAHGDLLSVYLLDYSLVCDHETMVFFI